MHLTGFNAVKAPRVPQLRENHGNKENNNEKAIRPERGDSRRNAVTPSMAESVRGKRLAEIRGESSAWRPVRYVLRCLRSPRRGSIPYVRLVAAKQERGHHRES